MRNCTEITKLISQSQERKLTLGEKVELRLHTMVCEGCNNYKHNVESLRSLLKAQNSPKKTLTNDAKPKPSNQNDSY